jgi:O-methyltransferase
MIKRISLWFDDIVFGGLLRRIYANLVQATANMAVLNTSLSTMAERVALAENGLQQINHTLAAHAEATRLLGQDVAAIRQIETVGVDKIQALAAQADFITAGMNNQKAEAIARLSLVEYNIAKLVKTAAPAPKAGGKTKAAADPTLYLDLLQASLTGELAKDGAISPWSKGKYDAQARLVGHDWPASALTMIGTARMGNVRHLLERVIEAGVPGDFIETGVWRGGACIYAKGIFKAHGETQRNVWVADSFKGLPPPSPELYPEDAGDEHHTVSELAVSSDDVRASFARYGLLDERVHFLEGWFKDTLPGAPIREIAVLRLDGDMYESTMDALVALYDKVAVGGFVVVDDYVLPACAKAIHDFLDKRGITARLEAVDGAAVFWQKLG